MPKELKLPDQIIDVLEAYIDEADSLQRKVDQQLALIKARLDTTVTLICKAERFATDGEKIRLDSERWVIELVEEAEAEEKREAE